MGVWGCGGVGVWGCGGVGVWGCGAWGRGGVGVWGCGGVGVWGCGGVGVWGWGCGGNNNNSINCIATAGTTRVLYQHHQYRPTVAPSPSPTPASHHHHDDSDDDHDSRQLPQLIEGSFVRCVYVQLTRLSCGSIQGNSRMGFKIVACLIP